MATTLERLATLETQVGYIRADVTSIKADVRTLVSVSVVARMVPWAALIAAATALIIK